jgi:hypothetical protein
MTRPADTADYLAAELEAAGASPEMVAKARAGYYHDFRSPLPMPISQLVADLVSARLPVLARRAREGDFDATKDEAEAWAASPEGQETFRDLLGGTP